MIWKINYDKIKSCHLLVTLSYAANGGWHFGLVLVGADCLLLITKYVNESTVGVYKILNTCSS